MDASQALADLMEISSQVEAAVLLDESGDTLGSTLPDERARELAGVARELLAAAAELRPGSEEAPTQLEAATPDGSVFVVRDGSRLLAATTGPSPTVGLVFYDLKTCLRAVAEVKPKPKRPRRRKKVAEDGDAVG